MDGVPFEELAREFGTPLYVYSADAIRKTLSEFRQGAGDRSFLVCYAVKANSNLAVLNLVREAGGGADIVSGGELFRARKAGVPTNRIVFSGVGKTEPEIREAIRADILLFIVESEGELRQLSRIAADMNKTARISIRVNPDVDAGTHPYISTGMKENKFGISHKDIPKMYKLALSLKGIEPVAIGCHIGSQLTDLAPFRDALKILKSLALEIKELGVKLRYIDVGGGLGISYNDETPPSTEEYVRMIMSEIDLPEITVIFEPGRSMVGNAGVLLTRVLYEKVNEGKQFFICDAAMNDLIRPALYQAHHEVLPVAEKTAMTKNEADLVGPVCETADFLAKSRILPDFNPDDLAVLSSAGAYSFVMSSNYNSRPRAAEILLDKGQAKLVRKRESYEDLIRGETVG